MTKIVASAVCAGAIALSASIEAAVIPVLGAGNDFPANQISTVTGRTGLGEINVLRWLDAKADEAGLPDPTRNMFSYEGGLIEAGDYLVLHYGVGNGGVPGTGGGLVAFYFPEALSTFDVPPNGAGPNGKGGLSWARLYDHIPQLEVPDSGTTLALLGFGLTGISLLSRSLRRKK